MTERVRSVFVIVACMVAVLAVAGFAAHRSFKQRIETRFEAIRRETPGIGTSESADAKVLLTRLDEIDRWVAEHTSEKDRFGMPWSQAAEDVVDLPVRLDRKESFFEGVEALTGSEACRIFLERDGYLDTPTRRLVLTRTRTNLLCAKAWIDQRITGDSAAAARHLAQALDLARLGDDGRAIGLMIAVASEGIVLSTLQEILRDPHTDARVLRDELDARLTRMTDPGRLRRTLVRDFECCRERVPKDSLAGLFYEYRAVGELERAIDLASLSGVEADACFRSRGESSSRFDNGWPGIAMSWHLARTRNDLARAALAVASRTEAPLPVDPYTSRPFDREETPEGVRISSKTAIQALGDPSKPYLLRWTIPL